MEETILNKRQLAKLMDVRSANAYSGWYDRYLYGKEKKQK